MRWNQDVGVRPWSQCYLLRSSNSTPTASSLTTKRGGSSMRRIDPYDPWCLRMGAISDVSRCHDEYIRSVDGLWSLHPGIVCRRAHHCVAGCADRWSHGRRLWNRGSSIQFAFWVMPLWCGRFGIVNGPYSFGLCRVFERITHKSYKKQSSYRMMTNNQIKTSTQTSQRRNFQDDSTVRQISTSATMKSIVAFYFQG